MSQQGELLTIKDYEGVAFSFLSALKFFGDDDFLKDDTFQQVLEIMEQFEFICNDDYYSQVADIFVVSSSDFREELVSEVKRLQKDITFSGLLGIIIHSLDIIVYAVMRESICSKLAEIAKDVHQKILELGEPVISLYISRIFIGIAGEYLSEFRRINSEDVSDIFSIEYPVFDNPIKLAYISGQLFGSGLVRYYLEGRLRGGG